MTQLKTCSGCTQEKVIWKSQGREKYCKACWFRMNPPAPLRTSNKPIKAVADKRNKQNKEYSSIRKVHLEEKPFCELKLPGCGGFATEVHHMKGRIGNLLTNRRYFKSTCRSCHQWVTENSMEAIQLGLSLSRHNQSDEKDNPPADIISNEPGDTSPGNQRS